MSMEEWPRVDEYMYWNSHYGPPQPRPVVFGSIDQPDARQTPSPVPEQTREEPRAFTVFSVGLTPAEREKRTQSCPEVIDLTESDSKDRKWQFGSTSESEWEVQDFGYGFGSASGTGYAVAFSREQMDIRERERAREDVDISPRRGFQRGRGRGYQRGRRYQPGRQSFSDSQYSNHYPAPAYDSPPPLPVPVSVLTFPIDLTRWYLLGQLEYYLSPQNMAQDFFLRQQMDSRGWIPIPLLASFNRVKQLLAGGDVHLVRDVLVLSSIAQVYSTERGDWVRMLGWEQFVLPDAPLSTVESPEEDDEEEEDVVFVMGREAALWTPERRS